jgi:hypothetical protein
MHSIVSGSLRKGNKRVGDGVMENKSMEGIAQHYTPARVEIAGGILLDPALPLAA